MNKCCRCWSKSTVGIDFIPYSYIDYETQTLKEGFRYLHHFCDIHFLLSYHAFYMSTNVGWEISYSFSDNKEVREIVADSFTKLYSNISNGHTDGDSVVSTDVRVRNDSVRDAWSVSRTSNTGTWKRKGGKAK